MLDIKPYLPWAEARPEARAGFAPETPPRLPVDFSTVSETTLAGRADGDSLRALIIQILAQDPRPAYHRRTLGGDHDRIYGVRLRDVDVRFRAVSCSHGTQMEVVEIVAT